MKDKEADKYLTSVKELKIAIKRVLAQKITAENCKT